MNKHYIFVYGTLMNGQALNKMLVEGRYIGKAQTEYGYDIYARGIPYMVRTAPSYRNRRVHGEIWAISDNTLALLDQLEGHPHAYKREEVRVSGEIACINHGSSPTSYEEWVYSSLPAQAYIYQHEPPVGAVLVESGDFNDYKQKVATS